MRIDAHQHFWKYDPAEYGWMDASMGVLKRDRLPPDLEPLLAAAGFDGSVAVQARQSLAETEWLLDLADRHGFIRGVVGWVDLRSPDVGAQLARFAARPKLRGVRHVVQDEPDDWFLTRPDVQRGIARLREFRLTYDLLVYTRQLPAAFELVEDFPDQPFAIDHLAKPGIRDRGMSPWKDMIRALAGFPNVCCKLSGMVTEAAWGRWTPADFHPYLDVVLEAFGPGRLMIGSDWPVCTLSGEYAAVMDIVIRYIGRLTAAEREGILGGTCARFYGLPPA
jgi:L-fuconolactonase